MVLQRELLDDIATDSCLSAGHLVVLAACDSEYVTHAVSLVRSLEVFSPGQTIILHLVNPTNDVLQRLDMLGRQLKRTRLVLSRERIELGSMTDLLRRTYYACARFLRLAELIQASGCDYLVLDADSLVVAPIDRNFSDKPEAEVCLLRRDLGGPVTEQLAVAAGSVWTRSTPNSRRFFNAVAEDIQSTFADGSAAWYLDQTILKRRMDDKSIPVIVRNIKSKYADWEFRDDSVVWQAKGTRKYLDLRYLLLQGGLSDNRQEVRRSERLYKEFLRFTDSTNRAPLDRRMAMLIAARPRRVVFLLPRLDLPWKRQGMRKDGPAKLEADVLDLRLYWVRFISQLANTCERAGLHVEVQELPAWEITREYVESLDAAVVLVPHRCKFDFDPGRTPVLFYMQEYFRWLFVVDEQGWSAASTVYPVRISALPAGPSGAYDEYRLRLARGELQSKFLQPNSQKPQEPDASGLVPGQIGDSPLPAKIYSFTQRWVERLAGRFTVRPRPPSVFFPLQIPHDQSIRYFSDNEFDTVLDAVVQWGERTGVIVMLKPHPANMLVMSRYMERYAEGPWLRWRNDNIHELIANTDAVFTVNSGVGFEALLHAKPIVTFGRAEYDCVTVRARIDAIDAAWHDCLTGSSIEREARYRVFFDWFMTTHAVDMSRTEPASLRFTELAARVAALARGSERKEDEVMVR